MWRRERPRLVPRTPRTTCNDSDHGQLHTLHDRPARRSGAAEATGPEGTTTALGREGALSVPQGSPERVAAGSGTERSGVSESPRPPPHGPGCLPRFPAPGACRLTEKRRLRRNSPAPHPAPTCDLAGWTTGNDEAPLGRPRGGRFPPPTEAGAQPGAAVFPRGLQWRPRPSPHPRPAALLTRLHSCAEAQVTGISEAPPPRPPPGASAAARPAPLTQLALPRPCPSPSPGPQTHEKAGAPRSRLLRTASSLCAGVCPGRGLSGPAPLCAAGLESQQGLGWSFRLAIVLTGRLDTAIRNANLPADPTAGCSRLRPELRRSPSQVAGVHRGTAPVVTCW